MTSPAAGEGAPDVTVSVVNTSNRELLLACLAALERERGGATTFEVVVLDNASTDGSESAVRAAQPWVRVIAQPRRAGFGANHNTIVRATRGRYVWVLNEDTVVERGSFERMVAYLDAHPEVAALGPRVVYPDGRDQPSAWRFPSPARAAIGALTLGRAGVVQSGGNDIRTVDWTHGCALLVRRSAFEAVGLFDEGFFIYSEETDLCRRLRAARHQVVYFPPVTLVHVGSQTSAQVPERRINEQWRSRHRYWLKHHSPAAARTAAVLTGWQYAVRSALAAAAGRLPPERRPFPVSPIDAAQYRLNAANAWRGVRGGGLAELALEWNRAHGVDG